MPFPSNTCTSLALHNFRIFVSLSQRLSFPYLVVRVLPSIDKHKLNWILAAPISLILLPPICYVSVKFPRLSFFIMFHRKFKCLFTIVYRCFLVSFLFKNSFLHTCSFYSILRICPSLDVYILHFKLLTVVCYCQWVQRSLPKRVIINHFLYFFVNTLLCIRSGTTSL